MADESVIALGEKFQQLRKLAGKYSGGEYNEAVDAPDGEKFKVMKALEGQLGHPGTPAADILSRLGKPDELTPSLQGNAGIPIMPGPALDAAGVTTQQSQQPPYYFVYYWRQKHDYLYFKIDSVKETVIGAGWHLTKE
ncbi:hypothetical protein BX666DRAFT_1850902 [Dichotomocladium elegans]|nr:hypothetical protein BX666DRAFT_1850902 [Dichotomocladium elegans]